MTECIDDLEQLEVLCNEKIGVEGNAHYEQQDFFRKSASKKGAVSHNSSAWLSFSDGADMFNQQAKQKKKLTEALKPSFWTWLQATSTSETPDDLYEELPSEKQQ